PPRPRELETKKGAPTGAPFFFRPCLVVQDQVRDDARGNRHQQVVAGVASAPVVTARRAAQAVVVVVVDHVGAAVARPVIAVPTGPAWRATVHHHRPLHVADAIAVDAAGRRMAFDPALVAAGMATVLPAVAAVLEAQGLAPVAAVAVVLAVVVLPVVAALPAIMVAAARGRRQGDDGRQRQQEG